MDLFDLGLHKPDPVLIGPTDPGEGRDRGSGVLVTKPYGFIGFGAMDVTKPYECIGFGATMGVTKPYEWVCVAAFCELQSGC